MKRRIWLLALYLSFALVFTAILALTSQKAEAIPAFARKYKVSCSTCHVAIPKLKDYGDEFAGNGFMLPDGEEPTRAVIDTGDDDLMLLRELPVAIRLDAYLQAADRETAETDFQVPYGLKLMSGGPIAKGISYYFYFYVDERGEVAGLEDAYVHFNNIGKTNFDLMVGQFQVSDPLFKRELRLTFEDYQVYRVQPGESSADLTYDRGLMATYGFDFGLDLVAELVNGNGIGPAENRLFDFDNQKTVALRASQSMGPVRVGVFGYRGEEKSEKDQENTIEVYGPDATFSMPNFEINAQYLYRQDNNPFFVSANASQVAVKGGFVEVIYLPNADRSKWIFTGLYNRIDGPGEPYDYETGTFSISRLLARNFRLLGEFTYDFDSEKPRFTLGFVSAF